MALTLKAADFVEKSRQNQIFDKVRHLMDLFCVQLNSFLFSIGFLYFVIASTEAVLRVIKPKNDLSSGTMLAGIPLAVIDRYII